MMSLKTFIATLIKNETIIETEQLKVDLLNLTAVVQKQSDLIAKMVSAIEEDRQAINSLSDALMMVAQSHQISIIKNYSKVEDDLLN